MSFQAFLESTNMPYAVSDIGAVLFTGFTYPNGDTARVYITGGCLSGNYCTLDAATKVYNCWCTEITNRVIYFRPNSNPPSYHFSNSQNMPVDRYRHTSVGVGSTLWVFGGVDLVGNLIKSVYCLDTMSDTATWKHAFDWPDATVNLGSWAYGTKIYLVGGYDANWNTMSTLTVIDTSLLSGQTFPIANPPFVIKSPMNVGRGDLATVLSLPTATAYAIGGWNGSDVNSFGQWCSNYKVAEAYDIKTDKWTRLPDLLYGRGDPVAGLLDNYLFSIGGETKSDAVCSLSAPVGTVGRYDLSASSSTSKWVYEDSILLDLFRFIGVSDNVNNTKVVYLFGGQGAYEPFTTPKNISGNIFVGYYPVKDATIKYIPVSLQSSQQTPPLSAGGIAGIVIAVVFFVLGVGCSALVYFGRYRFYTHADIELSKHLPSGEEGGKTELDKLSEVEIGRI